MNRIFISYSRKDEDLLAEFVRQLDALKQRGGIDYWYDKDRDDGVRPGEHFLDRLTTEVARSAVFCIFLTSYWTFSSWCRAELELAVKASKPIVPIQVRKVSPPAEIDPNSRLPNSDSWIEAMEQPARRDALWYEVVEALGKMIPGSVRGAGPPGAPGVTKFNTIVRRLACYKRVHDVAHRVLEGHLKHLEDRVNLLEDRGGQAGDLRAEDVKRAVRLAALVASELRDTLGELQAIRDDSATLLDAAGKNGIESILLALAEARDKIGDFSARRLQQGAGLASEIIGLKSSLQRALTYFGGQIERYGQSFDPMRYVNDLQGAVAPAASLASVDERWARDLAERHYRKLTEHVLLQEVQDRIVRNVPDVTPLGQFVSDWRFIRKSLRPFVTAWREAGAGGGVEEEVAELQRQLIRSFDGLDGLMSTNVSGDVWPGDVTSAVDEFLREFGAYFLHVDKALKAEYEDVMAKLEP